MIHRDNPFTDPAEGRSQARRFRGRLAHPVTIVTSGSEDRRTGLTISSLVVAEGEPGQVQILVGPNSDLWDVAASSGRFIVHICEEPHRALADIFAGIRPSPGGLFNGLDIDQTDWGPVLAELPNRLYCSFANRVETGWSGVVGGLIDRVEVSDLADPLIHFRGEYRSLS